MTIVTDVNSATSTSTTATSAAASTSSSATTALSQNYDTFLKLLTTQMQYQDPLQPEDSSQFTNQLVLFSQVEQQIDTNTTLSSILSGQSTNTTQQALGYLGLNVTANGSTFDYTGSNVNLGYTLPSTAATATVGIFDSNGNEVFQGNADTSSGAHQFTWNGEDGSGDAVDPGAYTIQLTAADSTGAPIAGTTQIPGTVTGVTSSNGSTYLTVNGQQLAESDILSATIPTSSSSTDSQTASN